MDKLSVPEAAERLGVTQDAVRKRIHRDAISWEKDGDGRYYVYLEDTDDTTRNTYRDTRHDNSRDALLRAMQDQIDTLKQEVADWKEEARRKDHLLAAALERIPEIDAPPEPRESPPAPSGEENGAQPSPEPEKRSWWRQFFGV